MPAQKRSNDSENEENELQLNNDESEALNDGVQQPEEQQQQQESNYDEDDDSSSSSSSSDEDEFVYVKLAEIRKDVQCPICLGIIRKTRKVMECLHRFCRECIDKSMRLGNNECPACRTHCASRRSLRDDPNYDALIALLYPDIDKYEAEELAFDVDDKARNKKIQASIEQTSRRQTEALRKKRASAKATVNAFRRSQGNTRNLRGRKRKRSAEPQGSDNELDHDNDIGDKYSSSSDELEPEPEPEPTTEVRPKRYKRWSGGPSSLPSASGSNGGYDGNEPEGPRRTIGSQENLAWGCGGMRSNTRHGGQIASKSSRNRQLSKLINHIQKLPRNDNELGIHLRFISMGEDEKVNNLQYSYVCCKPTMSITNVRQYVARESGFQVEDVELFLALWGRREGDMSLLEDHQTVSDLTKMSITGNLTVYFRGKRGQSEG